MYVYRVEHKEIGIGPYQCCVAYSPRLYDDDHPSPTQSGIEMEPDDFSCFAKPTDLTKWFRSSEMSEFKKYGFDVYRYEVKPDHVKLGDKQAAFKKAKAYKRERVTVH